MNKRIIIIVVVILLIIAGIGTSIILHNKFLKKKNKNSIIVEQKINLDEFYGKRGSITETERVSFLIKGDELLVGMMGINPNTTETSFTEENMVVFAEYIAQERYSSMLTEKKNWKSGEYEYYIDSEVIDSIIKEFFGKEGLTYSGTSEVYNYMTSSKQFVFKQDLAKSLWYYPVSQEDSEDRTVITVDSVYLNDNQDDYSVRETKFEGKYGKDMIDSTIKFIYDKNGYLIGYQYIS